MKTLTLLGLALLAVAPVSAAQASRPDAGRGGPAGEPRSGGHESVVRSGSRHDHGHRSRTSVSVGFYSGYYPLRNHVGYRGYGGSYGYYGSPAYYDYGYTYYSPAPVYHSSIGTGSAATNGFWLGALAGGIIGHNSGSLGHNGWRGAAWGAGLGWLLGSVADANRRATVADAPAVVTATTPVAASAPVAVEASRPVVVAPAAAAPATPMTAANGLFGR